MARSHDGRKAFLRERGRGERRQPYDGLRRAWRSIGVPCASVAAASVGRVALVVSMAAALGSLTMVSGERRQGCLPPVVASASHVRFRRAWPCGAWQDCTAAGRRLGASHVRFVATRRTVGACGRSSCRAWPMALQELELCPQALRARSRASWPRKAPCDQRRSCQWRTGRRLGVLGSVQGALRAQDARKSLIAAGFSESSPFFATRG